MIYQKEVYDKRSLIMAAKSVVDNAMENDRTLT